MKKRTVQQTSVDAYLSILDTLSESQGAVYEYLAKNGPASNFTIAKGLKKPINRITPRTNELVEQKLVVAVGKSLQSETGRKVIIWDINRKEEEPQRFKVVSSILSSIFGK